MKIFRRAIKRISSLAKYFFTKTVSNYNLEYANFETTHNLPCRYFFSISKKIISIVILLLLTSKKEFHILIIILFTCGLSK